MLKNLSDKLFFNMKRIKQLNEELSKPSSILVIEDDQETADALCNIIKSEGYQARAVYTGQDGMREVDTFQYDAVFLDLMMPQTDGIDILYRLRKVRKKPYIILVTGVNDIEYLRSLAEVYPIFTYIIKPFSAAIIREALQSLNLQRPHEPQ